MAELKARYGAPLVCFGPHASCTPHESMRRAPAVDGMIVGEPEDALEAIGAAESPAAFDGIPSLTFRRDGQIVPHRGHGTFTGFLDAPGPAWDLLDLSTVPAAARQRALRDCRSLTWLPVHVRLLRGADPSGPQVPREERAHARRRDGTGLPRPRPAVLLSLGRHGHPEREDVCGLLRRAHCPEAASPVVRQRPCRQPHQPGLRQAAAQGRLLDARAGHRNGIRRHAQGHDETARGPEDPGGDRQHARGGHPVLRLLHSGIPRRHARITRADDRLRHRSGAGLCQLLPGRPLPGDRALREGARAGPPRERRLDAHGVLALPALGQRPRRADGDGRHQPRPAALLPPPGVSRTARG